MTLLLGSAIKVSILLCAGLICLLVMRRASAALRHWVLAVAVIGALITPFLTPVVPTWRLPVEPPSVAVLTVAAVPSSSTTVATHVSMRPVLLRTTSEVGITIQRALIATWLAGSICGVAMLLIGLGRLFWLARQCRTVTDARLVRMCRDIADAHGLRRRINLVQSSRPGVLMTWGYWPPKIMLPSDAAGWSDARAQAALAHELAHVKRRDWLLQMAAEVLRAIYWVSPPAWMTARRLRLESEQASDDAVLSLGVDSRDYATELVDLARTAARRRVWMPTAAMAQRSSLERRVKAMLNTGISRRPTSSTFRVATACVAVAVATLVAGMGATAQNVFSTFSGSIFDATNAVLPDATVTLTHLATGSKYEVKSDRNGGFEFVGLRPGDYTFQAKLPGFAIFEGQVAIAGDRVSQNLTMQVGILEETIAVVVPLKDDGTGNGSASAPLLTTRRDLRRPVPPCATTAPDSNIGGNIRPPRKLVDVRPKYPDNLRGTGTDGIVVMNARIGTDGHVREIEVVESPHDDLARAADDAVRQWEFDETLLNCLPQEVMMKVTVKFIVAPGAPPPPPGEAVQRHGAGRL
jgi:TonB family protein